MDGRALVAATDTVISGLEAERTAAFAQIAALDDEQTALGHHPNYPAYIAGGMLADRGFGRDHILAVLGFHALDWSVAFAKLERAPADCEPDCLLTRMRLACEADPMLEIEGHALLAELGLLKRGKIDPFWLKRPELGLGQAAKAFGLGLAHANGHRGLYTLTTAVLRCGFELIGAGGDDQRYGALLRAVIEAEADRLAEDGAAAFHRDAAARYRDDCCRFDAHQRANHDRRWRAKPPLSRQGHLAVTTARAKDIAVPAERTRGAAAGWLDAAGANIRFTGKD